MPRTKQKNRKPKGKVTVIDAIINEMKSSSDETCNNPATLSILKKVRDELQKGVKDEVIQQRVRDGMMKNSSSDKCMICGDTEELNDGPLVRLKCIDKEIRSFCTTCAMIQTNMS